MFPTLPRLKVGGLDFVRLLRHQANVIVTPGTEFGPHERSIRRNYSQDREAAVHAAHRSVEMTTRYRIWRVDCAIEAKPTGEKIKTYISGRLNDL